MYYQARCYLHIIPEPLVPGPPQGVTVQRVEPYSLKVTWTNPMSFPSPLISQYTIRHYKVRQRVMMVNYDGYDICKSDDGELQLGIKFVIK